MEHAEEKPRHINCFHITKYASLGFTLTMLIFAAVVMRNGALDRILWFALTMVPGFIISLWLTVNTVGLRLYKPQTAGRHLGLAYAGTLMILYLTPTLTFLGIQIWEWMEKGVFRPNEIFASLWLYPAVGMIYGLPGAIIFGTLLGKSVHARLGQPHPAG